jgi:hypothetical protein
VSARWLRSQPEASSEHSPRLFLTLGSHGRGKIRVPSHFKAVSYAGTTVTFPFAATTGILDDTHQQADRQFYDWFLVRKNSNDPAKSQDLAAFLGWMIDAGQPVAENLGYAPVPRKLAVQVKKMIAQLR